MFIVLGRDTTRIGTQHRDSHGIFAFLPGILLSILLARGYLLNQTLPKKPRLDRIIIPHIQLPTLNRKLRGPPALVFQAA